MRTLVSLLALAGLLVFLGPAGATTPTGDGGPTTLPTGVTYCGSPATFDLFGGQTIDVGSITIVNDADTLYVTYHATGQNYFGTLHLWVGTDLADVPQTGTGNPIQGQFPYHYDANGGQTHTFEVPLGTDGLNVACGTELYVVAHAEVFVYVGENQWEEETAFGGNTPGPSGTRWWYYMPYTVQCCNGGGSFETAFAYGTHVFSSHKKSNPDNLEQLKLTRNRWGWAINVTEAGTHTWDIWAGAGLNNTDNGYLVGTLTLTWDGTDDVEVTYELEDGYTMSEIHVYAGDGAPTTIAPGQYGYIEYFDPYADEANATFTVEDTDGDGIWVIAHAVVYGEF